jgi:DNA-binding response OmpR family regulator
MAKVLVVEDHDELREMVVRRLRRQAFDIVCASDGHQAAVLAQSERPDIILLDLRLPGMTGWEVARLLKSAISTESIPIIALTAHALVDERDSALAAGCDEYETKPIDFPQLVAKMERLLGRASERAARVDVGSGAT